jgi:chromatin assembly factor 1 subunit B
VIIWQLRSCPVEFGKLEDGIQWGAPRQLRGHVGDVMDLCWSSDSSHLLSGSLDGSAILWSIKENKYTKLQTFEGHKKFVQGVALHPNMKLIATASSDATVRIYQNRKLKQ